MKHWFVRICAFLLLGAIVNVAVAWACASCSRLRREATVGMQITMNDDRVWALIDRAVGVGVDRHAVAFTFASHVTPTDRGSLRFFPSLHGGESTADAAPTPHWSRLGVEQHGNRRVRIEDEQVCGWPMRSMWCRLYPPLGVAADLNDGSALTWRNGPRHPDLVHGTLVPLRPIWPGFAINTVFYAVVLWLLFAGPFVLRRRTRIRRGLCPKCAYDLRGTPLDATACPECGATLSRTRIHA